MKNEIFQIASAAVIIVILITTLRGMKQEYAVVLSVMGAVLLLLWGMERIELPIRTSSGDRSKRARKRQR